MRKYLKFDKNFRIISYYPILISRNGEQITRIFQFRKKNSFNFGYRTAHFDDRVKATRNHSVQFQNAWFALKCHCTQFRFHFHCYERSSTM
jgi:site-specific DNA-adenine methylase